MNLGASRACGDKLTLTTCIEDEDGAGIRKSPQITRSSTVISLNTFHHTGHSSLNFLLSRHELSSIAGSTSNKEEEASEDAVQLDTPEEEIYDNELISEPDLDLSDGKDDIEILSGRRIAKSELFNAIANAPGSSVHHALEKWVEEGKELNREEISLAMSNFFRHRMYNKALQVNCSILYLLLICTVKLSKLFFFF